MPNTYCLSRKCTPENKRPITLLQSINLVDSTNGIRFAVSGRICWSFAINTEGICITPMWVAAVGRGRGCGTVLVSDTVLELTVLVLKKPQFLGAVTYGSRVPRRFAIPNMPIVLPAYCLLYCSEPESVDAILLSFTIIYTYSLWRSDNLNFIVYRNLRTIFLFINVVTLWFFFYRCCLDWSLLFAAINRLSSSISSSTTEVCNTVLFLWLLLLPTLLELSRYKKFNALCSVLS